MIKRMQQTLRLRRLAEVHRKLRRLELAELELRRTCLADAAAARQYSLECVAGAASKEQAYLATITGAQVRTARNLEAAVALVRDQTELLMDRTVAAELIARQLSAELARSRVEREAKALAEIIDQAAADAGDSAAKG